MVAPGDALDDVPAPPVLRRGDAGLLAGAVEDDRAAELGDPLEGDAPGLEFRGVRAAAQRSQPTAQYTGQARTESQGTGQQCGNRPAAVRGLSELDVVDLAHHAAIRVDHL